ncbi:MAG: 2Fe-2S iron-sulfur cluster binding domain-containing protein [Actinomycetales bacterium]|nr:2Fe-2S iron-sulfur cluster binding domain-containing protein [Actinomycetales bacterium]
MTETETRLREFESDLVVESYETVAEDVVTVTLVHPDGEPLPEWTPGAHIDLILTPEITRQYSLCGSPADSQRFTVGILNAPDSRGGSRFVHESVQNGSVIRIRGPRNHFPLVASPRYVFIAGGIGITPMLPMIAEAEAAGAEWSLLYGGRSEASMAFLPELTKYGDRVTLLPGNDVALMTSALDERLGTPRPGTLVYTCGPEGLLGAVEQRCGSWPPGSLHLERFAAKATEGAVDTEFEVELARTGITITVPADRSIFDAVQDHGISVLGSCHEGICGTCETVVIDGDVDHRDSVLNDEEKASNETIMICVSRCRSGRLTLDL